MRPSLGDSTQLPCPRCKGQGSIRNVESVALSVLRILEEEAMKKGTEKVIAHLPIECATFLLNEKRSAIEQIEARLKVGIVILPSKHLETPAYDIERIKEKDSAEEKPSYLQIKAEDITIPEFAQQVKPRAEKAAIKEFLHDSPAPIQNKNEAASLIKRFWHKLVGISTDDDIESKETPLSFSTSETKSLTENQPARNRNNRRGKNQSQSQQGKDVNQEPRPNRHPRGPGRNVRPNLDPASLPSPKTDLVKIAPDSRDEEAIVDSTAMVGQTAETGKQAAGRNNTRRGPNRRRPRNPNYKRPESDNEGNNGNGDAPSTEPRSESGSAPAGYDGDFAARKDKAESPTAPGQAGNMPNSESAKPVAESSSTAMIVIKPENNE
jgi:ribonuclease E